MADEAARPVDSGLQQADIAVENEQKAEAAKEKRKEKTLHLKEPAKPEPEETEVTHSDEDNGDSAGDEGEQPPETNPGKKKTPYGVQKKLDKLTREKYERDARIQYLEQQAQERAEREVPKPEGKPTLAQFDGDQEQYLEALSDWKVDAKLAEAETRKREREKETAEREKISTYQQRLNAFVAEHDDYEQVALQAPINYSETMLDFIKESERGPQIGYYLGQNLEEAKEIEKMPPMRQAIALDRIERGLVEPEKEESQGEPPPRRNITQAPPPPATIASGGTARRSINDPNLTPDERIAMWRRKKTG